MSSVNGLNELTTQKLGKDCNGSDKHIRIRDIINLIFKRKARENIEYILNSKFIVNAEAVTQRCSVKKVFLEVLQNSQENTYARVSFSIKLQGLGLQLF